MILVVDDEENIRKILHRMLTAEGYEVALARSIGEAKAFMREAPIQVVLTDLRLQREDGINLLKWAQKERYPQPVIILTAHGSIDSAVDAMKQGAFDYLSKPFDRAELVRVIQKALVTHQYQAHHGVVSMEPAGFPSIGAGGRGEKMQRVAQLVDRVAPTDASVLICGESGTGKELIAQIIHEKSSRSKEAFIKINCAAIPQTLMESELFGYERGAFTGAVNSKPGRFELADGGTLFLDEIAEMNVEMQVKLLRVLQDQTFERVGGIRSTKVNVRLITATNRQLDVEVKEGRFRNDLFYRLNVVPITLPPLRDRREDIPVLVAYFVSKFSEKLRKNVPEVQAETLELMREYSWPGNIRELENVMERVMVMNDGRAISPDDLPSEILEHPLEETTGAGSLKDQVREVTRKIEKRAIEEALKETGENVTQAAKKLNMSRKGLQLKMKELGLR